jgi:hypothetical protein
MTQHPAPAPAGDGRGAAESHPRGDRRPDIDARLDAHCKLSFSGSWEIMAEADRDYWRAYFRPYIEQTVRDEEPQP